MFAYIFFRYYYELLNNVLFTTYTTMYSDIWNSVLFITSDAHEMSHDAREMSYDAHQISQDVHQISYDKSVRASTNIRTASSGDGGLATSKMRHRTTGPNFSHSAPTCGRCDPI